MQNQCTSMEGQREALELRPASRGGPGRQSVGLWAASAQKERNPTLQSRPDHQREGRICLPRPHAHPIPGPPSPAQGKQEQREKPGPSAVHLQPLTRTCLNCLLPSPHHPKREPCSGHFPAQSPSWLLISPRDLLSWHSEPSWPLSLGLITAPEAPRLSHTAPNRTHRPHTWRPVIPTPCAHLFCTQP